jgi:hypothetical protein
MVAWQSSGSPGATTARAESGVATRRQSVSENWWRHVFESVAALAGELRSRLVSSASEVQLVVVHNQKSLDVFLARKSGQFDHVATLPEFLDANFMVELPRKLGRVPADRTVLRIASDRVIRKVVSLPHNALSFLPSIVRNKVESLSPWKSTDMLWGYRLVNGTADADCIAIEIGMTGKEPVNTLTTALKSAGIDAGRIEFGDSASSADSISVLPQASEGPRRSTRKVVVAAIAVGALSLSLGLAGGFNAWRAQQELQSLGGELQKLQKTLDDRSAAGGQVTEVSTALAMAARKQHDTPFILLFKDLTLSIPDGAWLQAIDFAEERLTITGKGGPVSPIITALEKSPLLQDVNFAAATQRQPADNQDNFSISAKLSPIPGGK